MENRLSLLGRYTKIHSDGYVDRAFSDLDSYNVTALFQDSKTKLRLMAFGGKEKTYQAWNGIDKTTWETNPRFNYSGAIYDADWENIVAFYDNETDNYRQNHYQFLWNQKFSNQWSLETTLHYTKGKGWYENYKQGDPFSIYNLPNYDGEEYSDFIRKKWLNNDFYGLVSTLYGKYKNLDLNFGIVGNQYYGRHYGNVSGVYFPEINEYVYYKNRSLKNEISGFAKAIIKFQNFEFFGDLQLRNIGYNTKIIMVGDDEGADLDKKWVFFNPKAGVNYQFENGKLYLSYAHAQREPSRDDLFANSDTKPERLHDFEAGLEKSFGSLRFTVGAYYMYYVNQLVLTGEINNVGTFIKGNSGKSYRLGLEIGAFTKFSEKWQISGNATISDNKNIDFKKETPNVLKNLGNTTISFSPHLIGNVSLNFMPAESLSFGLQNQYVGSQYLDNTNNDNLKLKNYFISDLNVKYSLKFKKTDIDFKFLLNNIFNKVYVNNGYVYDENPYYFSQAKMNFILGIILKIK